MLSSYSSTTRYRVRYFAEEKVESARHSRREKRGHLSHEVSSRIPKSADTTTQASSPSRSSGATNPREPIKPLTIFFDLPILFCRNFPPFLSDVSPPLLSRRFMSARLKATRSFRINLSVIGVACFDASRASPEHVATRIRSLTKCCLPSTNHTMNIFNFRPVSFF